MNSVEKTIDLHKNGGLNCSQAILTAFGERFGIDSETGKMLGRPWGGGIGHMAQTCGYLTGAILVLSKALENDEEGQARNDVIKAVRELFHQFEERRGSCNCRDLLGADLNTKEGINQIMEEDLVAKHCHSVNGIGWDVAEILEDLL